MTNTAYMTIPSSSDLLVDVSSFHLSVNEISRLSGKTPGAVRRVAAGYAAVGGDDLKLPELAVVMTLEDLLPKFRAFILTRWMEFERQNYKSGSVTTDVLKMNSLTLEEKSKATQALTGFDLTKMGSKASFLTYRAATRKLGLERTELTGVLCRLGLAEEQRGGLRSTGNVYVINYGVKEVKVDAAALQQDHMEMIEKVIHVRNNKDYV